MSQRKTDILFKAQTMKSEARFTTKKNKNFLIETHKSYLNLFPNTLRKSIGIIDDLFLVYLGINGLEI